MKIKKMATLDFTLTLLTEQAPQEVFQAINKTQLVFTHEGLTPEIECYESCAPSWSQYLHTKLLPLINTGKVQ